MEYSVFISYRRVGFERKFIENFKEMLKTEAGAATGISQVFFDEDSIDWGKEFDDKIYDGIISSCFFIPVYQYIYLSEERTWCARELYHAIEVEKRIREINPDFCFILPVIHRGSTEDLPECIDRKNVIHIHLYESNIANNTKPQKFMNLKKRICDILHKNYRLLHTIGDIKDLCEDIHKPEKEEIKEWIRRHNKSLKQQEASKLPILRKNAE